ncbi:cupin-like domain-containing protein [Actinomadura sp. WMMB 499]|uniref:cupin-like domain-containing protein n=1 Tax=Actinomadura sp. WMMB 499 TaxID=1219491 RepID=UPI00124457AC|nr:cupin-like domain-containing protein [Actinomadura sp. WMMB 499]QFG23660.1 cupin-like domain-containing protein [Actinomadura sp. WMMB 499]
MAPPVEQWRRWIAENLLLGNPPEAIRAVLVRNAFTEADAAREVNAALESPYVQGGSRVANRLRKREWTLTVYGRLARMRASSGVIERRERPSRDEFFEEYYAQNRPVIITGMLKSWPALEKWNLGYFRDRCGDREVEVQFGRESDENYEINGPKHKRAMPFREYLDLLENAGTTNDFYMTANNGSRNQDALAELWSDIDPIDEYLDGDARDKSFFWLGPEGTKTPYHHDLTNNFMAQVIGRKHVKLVPLHDTAYIYNNVHCYSEVDASDVDPARFPKMRSAQVHECTLAPGELLFIPIGWWHYVEGLDTTATMSFTNFRRYNDFAENYTTFQHL